LILCIRATFRKIRALEDFRPDIVTELYADDGQVIGSFALQRRILLSYEQIPQVPERPPSSRPKISTSNSIGAWTLRGWQGAAWRNLLAHRVAEAPAR